MKTASIVASLSRKAGGLFESVRRLHQSLADIPEVSVTVLGLRDAFTETDLPQWQPLRVQAFAVAGPSAFGYAPGLKKTLLELDEDIIHTHGIWMYPSVAASAWQRATRRPYLISPHGMLDPWALRNSAWKKAIAGLLYENKHLREAACLRALCEPEARSMRAAGLRNPICIIPNGIDLPNRGDDSLAAGAASPAEAHGRAAYPPWQGWFQEKRKALLYLGRLHPKKNVPNLLDAWARVQRDRCAGDWVLAIAGWDQGGHEQELRLRIAERRIGHSVVMCGPQYGEAKAMAYGSADAFVLPSLSEGLPMTILEAWAYGKAVLMTPECNLPEGFKYAAALRIETSVQGIASGLVRLFSMKDAALRDMGCRGRKLVTERFSWPGIAGEMKAVYDWLLGGGSAPACVWKQD